MDKQAHILLAQTSIRRLFSLRNETRHGSDARHALRQWACDLRALRSITP